MAVGLDEVVAALASDPASTALLFDFDGTLAAIVEDPSAARPRPGVPGLLEALAGRYQRVGVVSGRPLSFLAGQLGPAVALSGLYGLEWRIDGATVVHESARTWQPVVEDAVGRARRFVAASPGAEGVTVEDKRLSLTVHFRRAPGSARAVRAFAEATAADLGLVVREAKASVELHPPVELDKGSAVRSLAGTASTLSFFGDDVGDLPAFAALDAAAARGVVAWKVAVASPELPAAVAAAADLVVDEAAVVPLLERLAA